MTDQTPDNTETMPCTICEKPLQNWTANSEVNQPMNGTEFTSHGHYGSMFDPLRSNIWLELNICDKCLTAKAAKNLIRVAESTRVEPSITYTPYNPRTLDIDGV